MPRVGLADIFDYPQSASLAFLVEQGIAVVVVVVIAVVVVVIAVVVVVVAVLKRVA